MIIHMLKTQIQTKQIDPFVPYSVYLIQFMSQTSSVLKRGVDHVTVLPLSHAFGDIIRELYNHSTTLNTYQI